MMSHADTSTSEHGRCVRGDNGEGVLVVRMLYSPQSEVNGGESGLELSAGSQVTKSPTPDLLSEEDVADGGGGASEPGSEFMSPAKFSFSAPMDNIVVRSYLFPVM